MRRLSGSRLALAAAAFVGWGLFILACSEGPAWSPDGKKILFTFADHERGRSGVAVYDRDSDKVTVVFTREGTRAYVGPQWSHDGNQIIIATCDNELGTDIHLPGMRTGEPTRTIHVLTHVINDDCTLMSPLAELDKKLYLATEDVTYVVDYEAGRVLSHQPMQGLLFPQGNRIYELSMENDVVGIAIFNPDDFTTTPWFRISKEDLRARGLPVDEMFPEVAAISPSGEDVAFPVSTSRSTPSTIVVLSRNGHLQYLSPDFGFRKVDLGAVVWAPDGTKLYSTAIVTVPGSNARMFSIAEIPRAKGSKAIISPVVVYKNGFSGGEDLLAAPISLSPDGSTLAVTTAAFPDNSVSDDDRALYLINVADPDSELKKVNVPGLEKPSKKTDGTE